MPQIYINELQRPELVLEFLEYAPHRFLRVPTFHFHLIRPADSTMVGRINLRAVTNSLITQYAGHIGYEVHEAARGHRYAMTAVQMILPLACRLGLNPLWLTCDPGNQASRRTCELAGAHYVETVEVSPQSLMYAGGARHKARYRLDL